MLLATTYARSRLSMTPIVLLPPDLPAGLVLVVTDAEALRSRDPSIGARQGTLSVNGSLCGAEPSRLSPGELPAPYSLVDARALVVLAPVEDPRRGRGDTEGQRVLHHAAGHHTDRTLRRKPFE